MTKVIITNKISTVNNKIDSTVKSDCNFLKFSEMFEAKTSETLLIINLFI